MTRLYAPTVEERLARTQALLRGAYSASNGDEYMGDTANTETVTRLVSMALDEVNALVALDAGVLNVEWADKPPHEPLPGPTCRGLSAGAFSLLV